MKLTTAQKADARELANSETYNSLMRMRGGTKEDYEIILEARRIKRRNMPKPNITKKEAIRRRAEYLARYYGLEKLEKTSFKSEIDQEARIQAIAHLTQLKEMSAKEKKHVPAVEAKGKHYPALDKLFNGRINSLTHKEAIFCVRYLLKEQKMIDRLITKASQALQDAMP